MLDAGGPDCLMHFWLTRSKKGTLRFYFDSAAEPALAFPAHALLSGDIKIGSPLLQPHLGYAMLRFRVNSQDVPAKLDGYTPSVQPAPAFVLGMFDPRDGKFTLRVEVGGANPSSKGARYFFGLDCVTAKSHERDIYHPPCCPSF
jgi:hypothetical protein